MYILIKAITFVLSQAKQLMMYILIHVILLFNPKTTYNGHKHFYEVLNHYYFYVNTIVITNNVHINYPNKFFIVISWIMIFKKFIVELHTKY